MAPQRFIVTLDRTDELGPFGFHPLPRSFDVVDEDSDDGGCTEKLMSFVCGAVHVDLGPIRKLKSRRSAILLKRLKSKYISV
jgi:hypothetical protein